MTPRERIINVVRGLPTDRRPGVLCRYDVTPAHLWTQRNPGLSGQALIDAIKRGQEC